MGDRVNTYVEATFIGQHSSSFNQKHTYQLRVAQSWNKKLTVMATHGYDFKPLVDLQHTYTGLKDFLEDWHIERVVRLPTLGDEAIATP